MHMSFRDIGAIINKAKLEAERERGQLDENDDIKSRSRLCGPSTCFQKANRDNFDDN